MSAALPPTGQLHELTTSRFFAAMAVLLGHFGGFLSLPSWVSWFAGGFGVSFFFVLSGYILCYRYWDDFSGGVAASDYRRYFVARVARVYPSYVMALVLITILYVVVHSIWPGATGFPPNPVTSWLANLFAVQTFAPSYLTQQMWNAPSWSISTEFGFYITCPFILAYVARRAAGLRGLLAFFALTVVFGVAMQAATLVMVFKFGYEQGYWLDLIASRNIFWRIPEFLTGVVAARLLYGGHLSWLVSSPIVRNILLAASVGLVIVLNVAPWPADVRSLLIMRQFRLDLAYMIPFAGIVLALAAGPTLVSPAFRRPFAVFLGDISYGIYIYHWIPWTIVAWGNSAGMMLSERIVTGVIVLTILFSAASYIWYERPVRMYLRRQFAK